MLTSDDIRKLVDSFATRYDLENLATKKDLAVLKEDLVLVKEDLEKLRKEMATKTELRDVMTKLDAVFKEVLDMRTEQSMHLIQHDRINERLDRIEKVPAIAHAISK